MPQPLRSRGRSDEPWERGLYLLLLVVAIVVILYSLFGIATLLGYLPLSQNGGGGKQIQHPAVEARSPMDRIRDRPLAVEAGTAPCPRRPGVKLAAHAPSTGGSTLDALAPACAEVAPDRVTARSVAAPALVNGRAPGHEGASKPLDR